MLTTALFIATNADLSLDQVIAKLESISSVAFTYQRTLDYKSSNNYFNQTTWRVTLQVDRSTALGAKYRIESQTYLPAGYDGDVAWQVNQSGPVSTTFNPPLEHFDSISAFYNSILGLAATLKAAKKHPEVKIKSTGKGEFRVDYGTNRPSLIKAIERVDQPYQCAYFFDPNGMPIKFVAQLEKPGDTITTKFSDWDLKPNLKPGWCSPPSNVTEVAWPH
jgi:hypothetical protein